MHVSLYNQFGALNSGPVFDAIGQGLTELGIHVSYHNDQADVAVVWSMLWVGRMRHNRTVWQQFRQSGRPMIVAEVGMIDRGRTWKLGLNGTGRSAYPNLIIQPNREKSLGLRCKDWQQSGTHVLIATQRADSQQWQGQPAMNLWLQNTVTQLRKHTDRPIMVRPHPRYPVTVPLGCAVSSPRKISNTYDSFDFDTSIADAWAVINYNSAPGSQAVLSGVPAFVGADSLAAEVANHNIDAIEQPRRPNRDQWLTWLAHTEWTLSELSTGQPIKRLLDHVGRENLDGPGAQ